MMRNNHDLKLSAFKNAPGGFARSRSTSRAACALTFSSSSRLRASSSSCSLSVSQTKFPAPPLPVLADGSSAEVAALAEVGAVVELGLVDENVPFSVSSLGEYQFPAPPRPEVAYWLGIVVAASDVDLEVSSAFAPVVAVAGLCCASIS